MPDGCAPRRSARNSRAGRRPTEAHPARRGARGCPRSPLSCPAHGPDLPRARRDLRRRSRWRRGRSAPTRSRPGSRPTCSRCSRPAPDTRCITRSGSSRPRGRRRARPRPRARRLGGLALRRGDRALLGEPVRARPQRRACARGGDAVRRGRVHRGLGGPRGRGRENLTWRRRVPARGSGAGARGDPVAHCAPNVLAATPAPREAHRRQRGLRALRIPRSRRGARAVPQRAPPVLGAGRPRRVPPVPRGGVPRAARRRVGRGPAPRSPLDPSLGVRPLPRRPRRARRARVARRAPFGPRARRRRRRRDEARHLRARRRPAAGRGAEPLRPRLRGALPRRERVLRGGEAPRRRSSSSGGDPARRSRPPPWRSPPGCSCCAAGGPATRWCRRPRANPHGFLRVLGRALSRLGTGHPGQHWLDLARDAHPAEAIEGARAVLRLAPAFAAVTLFWALFDQRGSSWVFQARQLDLSLAGRAAVARAAAGAEPAPRARARAAPVTRGVPRARAARGLRSPPAEGLGGDVRDGGVVRRRGGAPDRPRRRPRAARAVAAPAVPAPHRSARCSSRSPRSSSGTRRRPGRCDPPSCRSGSSRSSRGTSSPRSQALLPLEGRRGSGSSRADARRRRRFRAITRGWRGAGGDRRRVAADLRAPTPPRPAGRGRDPAARGTLRSTQGTGGVSASARSGRAAGSLLAEVQRHEADRCRRPRVSLRAERCASAERRSRTRRRSRWS